LIILKPLTFYWATLYNADRTILSVMLTFPSSLGLRLHSCLPFLVSVFPFMHLITLDRVMKLEIQGGPQKISHYH